MTDRTADDGLDVATRIEKAAEMAVAGATDEAEALCDDILAAHPNLAPAHYVKGLVAFKKGDARTAEAAIERAIAGGAAPADWYRMLGLAKLERGALAEAARAFENALLRDPGDALAEVGLGDVLAARGRWREAASRYRRALDRQPDDPGILEKLGIALHCTERWQEAIAPLARAAALAPTASAFRSLGAALADCGRLGEAIAAFDSSLRLEPDSNEACVGLYGLLQTACDWSRMADLEHRIDAMNAEHLARNAPAPEPPLSNVGRCDDPAKNLAVARSWSKRIAEETARSGPPLAPLPRRDVRPERLTLGYLSADFHDHATAHLIAGLFPCHDRDRFAVIAYSYGPDDASTYRRAIERGVDRFVDLRETDDRAAACRIRDDGVHILIDLKGHTRRNRLGICAMRPAPIQVAYLGFPGTTGADFIDYLIADRTVIPKGQEKFYTEKIVVLPHSYQVNDRTQKISADPVSRQEMNLPEDAFVFCSFNNPAKIDPVMFAVWMELLHAVPRSVLWLFRNNPLAERNLRVAAEARGISGERLIFAEMVAKDRHLARLRLADLALDTRIYNGHTTTSDALWAGLPVVALEGRHFASRVSASLLRAMGVGNLVVDSLDAYRDLALRLARDRDTLEAFRRRLAETRLSAPLFDTSRFARALERAFEQMWRIHSAGEAPRAITVDSA